MEMCSEIGILSKSECVKIACRSLNRNDINISNIELINASESSIGYLGDYWRLHITVDDNDGQKQTYKYFVKTMPDRVGAEEEMSAIFNKELSLYPTLLQKLSKYNQTKWKPDCYLARPRVIVLEDLAQIGYKHLPQNISFSEDYVKCAVSNLAAFHSSSIAYECESGKNIGLEYKEILFETSIAKGLDWFMAGVEGLQCIAKIHPKFQSESHQDFILNKFVESVNPVYSMVEESSTFRNVLCHRDTWSNNTLFLFENNRPIKSILIDFQTCKYCPPAIDVLFTVYLNTRRNQRQAILEKGLKWYHERLSLELKQLGIDVRDHITYDSFLESCNYLKLVPILYNGIAATILHLPKGYLKNLQQTNPKMYEHYRTSSRGEVLLDAVEKDQECREYMFEVVEDIMDLIYTSYMLGSFFNYSSTYTASTYEIKLLFMFSLVLFVFFKKHNEMVGIIGR